MTGHSTIDNEYLIMNYIKILIELIVITVGVPFFSFCSEEMPFDVPVQNEVIMYLSENKIGNGDGLSSENAADYLDYRFWEEVNSLLISKSVEIIFLAGDYHRAFQEGGLQLRNIGNANNRLTVTGGREVIFHALEGYPLKSTIMIFRGCQNIHLRDFNFTGNGSINYVLQIRSEDDTLPSRNILIENCTWIDMNGVVYGATGAVLDRTSNVTYKNCIFKRIGRDPGSHMMYHAYGSTNIKVIDCHFEDCTGAYVRFRDRCDYGLVKNCTFIRNQDYIAVAFINVPCYNDVNPGDEYFATNYSFVENQFINRAYSEINDAILFSQRGYAPPQYNYLLTANGGAMLRDGSKYDRMKLLKDNFGLDVEKIRVTNNSYRTGFKNHVALYLQVDYGASSKGFVGKTVITDLLNNSSVPFDWEDL